MSRELVKVDNGGVGGVLELDPSMPLSHVRMILESARFGLMSDDQSFIVDGTPIEHSEEDAVHLGDVLAAPKGGDGPPVLTVGMGAQPILPKDTKWTMLSQGQQLEVLNVIEEVMKGIGIDEHQGMVKSTKDVVTPLTAASLPASTVPRVQSETNVNAYFSKFATSMATSCSQSASVSVTTPFGGGSTSFSHAQAHSSSSSKVTTSLVGTYKVNKVLLTLDPSKLQATNDFWSALAKAMDPSNSAASKFVDIVTVLNEFGWYFPISMNLGGMLYTSKTTESSSWSEAESSSDDFGASFHAAFDGIGGGGAYSSSSKSGSASQGAAGSSSLVFTAIGGDVANANDYPKWAVSLAPASNWSISEWISFIPSVCLLASHPNGKALAHAIQGIISNNYATSPELETLQPLVDCGGYATEINNFLFS